MLLGMPGISKPGMVMPASMAVASVKFRVSTPSLKLDVPSCFTAVMLSAVSWSASMAKGEAKV